MRSPYRPTRTAAGATWHTDGTHGYKIYVRPGAALNDVNRVAYDQTGIELPKPKGKKSAPKVPASDLRVLEDFMCANFYDVRAFGAVMSTKLTLPTDKSGGFSLRRR